MENSVRWVARWIDHMERERVYIFRGSESRIQARIELTIRLLDQGEPLPQGYEFDEIEAGIPIIPSPTGERRKPPRIKPIRLERGTYEHPILLDR